MSESTSDPGHRHSGGNEPPAARGERPGAEPGVMPAEGDQARGAHPAKRVDGRGMRPMHPALDAPSIDRSDSPRRKVDWVVFGVAAAAALGFVIWGAVSTSSLSAASTVGLDWVVHNAGWLFALAASGFVVYIIWIAISKYGRIPLGHNGQKPEFSIVSWIAMMFSAGMGIGLIFFGVTEPVSHFVTAPPGTEGAEQAEAVRTAMATTMFHWSVHPWAIYAVVGLALAYSTFRKGRSLLISSAFTAIVGKRVVRGPIGRAIDIFAIFATLFGSATSLGLGALQINSGLQIVAGIGELGNGVLIGIIAVLTCLFVLSAVSGVSRGIKWLSNTNMVLAGVLALFVFVVGPTVLILNLLPTTMFGYFEQFAFMSARTEAAGAGALSDWLSQWTIFYWAWWISWTPFVGMFIARISRGRTVRQFVGGVLVAPTLVSLVWFAIFGGLGIDLELGGVNLGSDGSEEEVLFNALAHLPLPEITSIIVMILVAIFFVSGADAASIVMGTLSHRGSLRPKRLTVIFWGVATGAVAAVMLLLGGENALDGLQQVTIIASLPFVLVMIALTFALLRDLSTDPLIVRSKYARAAVEQAVVNGVTAHGDDFELAVSQTPHGHGIGEQVDTTDIEVPDAVVPDAAAESDAARDGDAGSGAADARDGQSDARTDGDERPPA